ncbi:uncharacterized protein LOC134009676 isoform X1 [Osmerus eperlanus]|uniref:uncharacterized protein LOC134009676 isoform X1 n=1 Tax=Osmerus eperlanus TaxID=29151 RepID=UPI002E12E63E
MVPLYSILLFSNLCAAELVKILQPDPFQTADLGDIITIECLITTKIHFFVWYKLTTGKKLKLVAKVNRYSNRVKFADEFDSGQFTILLDQTKCHLRIQSTKPEDHGIYYCGVMVLDTIEFGSGTFLTLKGAKLDSSVFQQPIFESVQPGDSVTLNCAIQSETCPGEHSVYWFRHGSGESHPGILYTHGGRSDQCEKSPEAGSPTQSCVYNLPKRNLSLSDAGTYYCAVASCGEILFGNGTMLDIEDNESPFDLNLTVISLVVSNILLGTVAFLLARFICKSQRSINRAANINTQTHRNQASCPYLFILGFTRSCGLRNKHFLFERLYCG